MYPSAPQPNIVAPPMVGGMPPGFDPAMSAVMGGRAPMIQPSSPYQDQAKLLKVFKKLKEDAFDQRTTYERSWWRNLLYVLGRQWITYNTTRGQWEDKRLAKWVPRPVTNKMAETVDAITSVFQSVALGVNLKPDGNDPKDITTAETASKLAPAMHYEHQMDFVQREGDFWLITTGNAFLHPWWDKRRERGFILIPFEQCMACGEQSSPQEIVERGQVCPKCGSPQLIQAASPDGEPIGDRVGFGTGCTDIMSPFELAAPLAYTSLIECPYVIRKRFRPRFWYEKNAPELVDRLKFSTSSTDRSLQLLRALATQSDVGPGQAFLGGGADGQSEGIDEYELWMKPTKEFGEGLILRVVENGGEPEILPLPDEDTPGPLPYKTAKGEPIFNFIQLRYEKFGGRFWGRSPLDRLVQKQDQINQLDSLIQMIVQRVANPIWLEPKGAEVKRFTGEPGLVVKYNPMVANGNAKPEKIEGSNIPVSLFRLREMYVQDMEALAGTYDVIKGAKPTGVEAFSALQLLVERSQTRYGPVLFERGEAYRQWFQMAIELERQYGPVERTWAVLGPNRAWTFENFKTADLQGAVRVTVEDGSQTPKTSLGKRAAIEQLSNLGVINPANPDTAYRILEVFGQTDLYPGLDVSVSSALQEQDEFERWAATAEQVMPAVDPLTGAPPMEVDPQTGQAVPVGPSLSTQPPGARKPWHNDDVHYAEHLKWLNGDTVRQLLKEKPWLEPILAWMLQQHEFMIMQKEMQQAAAKGSPGGRAMQNSNAESGNPADVPRGQNQGAQNQGPQ